MAAEQKSFKDKVVEAGPDINKLPEDWTISGDKKSDADGINAAKGFKDWTPYY